jgi:hypothetical protein
MDDTFHVKDFEKFQHYKDRAPPWIKLYNEILDSYQFAKLPDNSRFHLVAIMLLASRSGNKIPYDPVWVSGRINSTTIVDLNLLIDLGFIVLDQGVQRVERDASGVLAICLPREEERERRGEKIDGAKAPIVNLFPKQDSHPSEEKSYFDRSVEILGPSGRGLAAKLLKAKKKVISHARLALEQSATKSNPKSYIGGIVNGSHDDNGGPAPGYGDDHW